MHSFLRHSLCSLCLSMLFSSCLRKTETPCVCPEPSMGVVALTAYYESLLITADDQVYIIHYKNNDYTGKIDSVMFDKNAAKRDGATSNFIYTDGTNVKSVLIKSNKINILYKINDIVVEDYKYTVECCGKTNSYPARRFVNYKVNGETSTEQPLKIQKK